MRVPVGQNKHLVIPVEDAPHGDLQVIQGTQAACPAHPARVTFRLYAGVPAGEIQKCFYRYSPNNRALSLYSACHCERTTVRVAIFFLIKIYRIISTYFRVFAKLHNSAFENLRGAT